MITQFFTHVSDQTAIRAGRAIALVSMLAATASVAIFVALGEFGLWYEEWGVHNAVGGFLFSLLLFTAVVRQPRNGAVWALGWSGVLQSIFQALAAAIAVFLVRDEYGVNAVADFRSIPDLSPEIQFFIWLGMWSWIPALGLFMTFGFLLFPDGRLPSRRWRPVSWIGAVSISGATIGMMAETDVAAQVDDASLPQATELLMPVLAATIFASVASLGFRYRRADGHERHQLRWIAYGAAVFCLAFVISLTIDLFRADDSPNSLSLPVSLIALPFLVGAYAMALFKYRLYDVDVVISKSVAYLGLAAIITAVFALVVAGPVLLIGQTDDGGPGLVLPVVATGVVAVLFEPVRSRMQRWANRLVYGQRSSPHEVLSQVTARLAESGSGGGTDDLARLLVEGTGAVRAVVWLVKGDEMVADGVWPMGESVAIKPVATSGLVGDELVVVAEVRHGDELLGAVSVTKSRSDPVTPADRVLVADVAAGAGLVLRNIGLNRELEERARQVRESRRRLIAAQDAERHRLERDLHDGAQQQVVALKVKLGIAQTLAGRAGVDEVGGLISGLAAETQQAVDALRAVAHGIYPPLLEAEGLEVALRAVERTSPVSLTVSVDGLGRYGRPVEETIYFCVLEAVERAHMGGAGQVRVDLHHDDGVLVMQLVHDGHVTNTDLTAVSDRIDAYGGTTTMTHSEGLSTITSQIPATQTVLEPV